MATWLQSSPSFQALPRGYRGGRSVRDNFPPGQGTLEVGARWAGCGMASQSPNPPRSAPSTGTRSPCPTPRAQTVVQSILVARTFFEHCEDKACSVASCAVLFAHVRTTGTNIVQGRDWTSCEGMHEANTPIGAARPITIEPPLLESPQNTLFRQCSRVAWTGVLHT